MDDRRLESALRSGPADEPAYFGNMSPAIAEPAETGENLAIRREGPVVDVTSRTIRPQRRRTAMLIAAAAILIVGLAAIVQRPGRHIVTVSTVPSETTTSTSTPVQTSALSAATPSPLINRWVGAPRQIPDLDRSTAAAAVVDIGTDYLSYETGIATSPVILDSRITAVGADVLRVELETVQGGCSAGAVGHYSWSLSAGGTTLTLTALDDVCSRRRSVLEGRWTHTDCPVSTQDCLGPVEAGSYASVTFDPYATYTYGQLSYEVPDGWAVTSDTQTRFVLQPAGDAGTASHGIYVWADVGRPRDGCSTTADAASTSANPTAIATWLATQSGLDVGQHATEIGGRPALTLDVQAVADSTETCPGGSPTSLRQLLTSRPGASTAWTWPIDAGQRMQITLIDLGDGHTVAICVTDASTPSRYDDLVAVAAPIIKSFLFSTTVPNP